MASDNRDKERKMRLQPAGDAAFVILDRPTFGRRPSFQMNNIPIQITNIRRINNSIESAIQTIVLVR